MQLVSSLMLCNWSANVFCMSKAMNESIYEEQVGLRDSENEGQQVGHLYLQQPNFLAKVLN
jgi:hypothetical protein